MEKLCTNKNHSYKHNEEINKQNIHVATKKKGGASNQNICNSERIGVTFVKIYPEMTS
jgi:hypothetical protein